MGFTSSSIFKNYLYLPRIGVRAITYLLLVWLVSALLFQEVSSSFFADIKNPLNQYFVKYAWGWTLFPLAILLSFTSLNLKGTLINSSSWYAWVRLILCSLVWYTFAQILFPHIEQITGVCQKSDLLTKRDCVRNQNGLQMEWI